MHPRAKKIANSFNDASVGRMAKGNERDFSTVPLFHYTTVEALFGIIKTETFWFTSVYHMDDDAELSFGFGISNSLLSAALQREDANVKRFLKPLVDDVGFARMKARIELYCQLWSKGRSEAMEGLRCRRSRRVIGTGAEILFLGEVGGLQARGKDVFREGPVRRGCCKRAPRRSRGQRHLFGQAGA